MKRNIAIYLFIALFLLTELALAGDSPEKVYESYVKAVKAGKFDEMLKLISSEQVKHLKKIPADKRPVLMQMYKGMLMDTYKVKDVKITGNTAQLEMEGTKEDPQTKETKKMYGQATFLDEGGKWKYLSQVWLDKPLK